MRKRKVDICSLQEIQWRGQGAHFIGAEERRYNLWGSGNDTGKVGVRILFKEELVSAVKIHRSDRMITICPIFGKEIIRVICVYTFYSEKPDIQKDKFHDKLVHKWDMKDTKKLTLGTVTDFVRES